MPGLNVICSQVKMPPTWRARPVDSLKGKPACGTYGEIATRAQKHSTNQDLFMAFAVPLRFETLRPPLFVQQRRPAGGRVHSPPHTEHTRGVERHQADPWNINESNDAIDDDEFEQCSNVEPPSTPKRGTTSESPRRRGPQRLTVR
jgi:hypothetical protein